MANLMQNPLVLYGGQVIIGLIGDSYKARLRTAVPTATETAAAAMDHLDQLIQQIDTGAVQQQGGGVVEPVPEVYSRYAPDMHVSVGCIPCARAHLAGVAADLKEALRFAREDGMGHPEVQTRLTTAEEEIVALERHDWTPEKITASSPEHQQIIRQYLPEIRNLRQKVLNDMDTINDLELAAAAAGEINTRFRRDVLLAGREQPAPAPGPAGGSGDSIHYKSCSDHNPRGCEISVGLGFAADIAEEAGVEAGYLRQLLQQGQASEDEVQEALDRFIKAVPVDSEYRPGARAVYCSVYPDKDNCNEFLKEVNTGAQSQEKTQ